MSKIKNASPVISFVGAAFVSAFGILWPWIELMLIAMLLDYITGMAAACWQGKLSSKIGIKGIFKKLAYLFMVATGMITDRILIAGGEYLGVHSLNVGTVALMVVIWIIINELISILENLGRMEVRLPKFLHIIIQSLNDAVNSDNPNLKG